MALYMTATDVSRRSRGKVTSRQVTEAAKRGEIGCIRTPSGVRLFAADDVDGWLTSRGRRRVHPSHSV